MLRYFIGICFLASCSTGIVKTGGNKSFQYDVSSNYLSDEIKELAPQIIERQVKEPPIGERSKLFSSTQRPIKRIGIVIFESIIQPSSLVPGDHKIYVTESGKQLLAENFLKIWEESFSLMAKDLVYLKVSKIKKAQSYALYGTDPVDLIKVKRLHLMPDDIFYLSSGKKTTSEAFVIPRGMRDMSLASVPAFELMKGPKFSEHSKHMINDMCSELKLDAVMIVMNHVSWTAAQTDEKTGSFIPEEIHLKIESTLIVPFSSYHDRLRKSSVYDEHLNINVPFAYYKGELNIPSLISVSPEMENFATIENELLMPIMKSYKDLTQMMIGRLDHDLKENP